jgi:hypothetical protein
MDLASVEHDRNTSSDPIEQMHAGSLFEATVRFIDWADSQRHLSAQKAMERFGMHRATAYRWINAYRAARGMHA